MSEPGWNDAQISRFTYRVGLFRRRGQTEQRAEELAEQLVGRDADRDDRRLCLECAGLQIVPAYGSGYAPPPRCGPATAAAGRKNSAKPPRPVEPVTDILQRCPHFTFQKP